MKQETYELLRAKCYEIIYDGEIPLEFGCEILSYAYIEYRKKIIVEEDTVFKYDSFWEKFDVAYMLNHNQAQILGKPLELGDLLIAFPETDINTNACLFYKEGYECAFVYDRFDDIQLDLTKTISEQSDEVGEQLLELIS